MAMSQAQKSLVTMLVALVVAGGVGAFVYYGVYKAEEKEKQQEEQKAKAFDFDKTKVKSVSLQGKGVTVKIDKVADGWQITSPVQARADKSSVDAIVDKMADLKAKDLNEASKGKLPPNYVVSDNAADLAKYGFDQPQYGATLVLEDGKQPTLSVGAENEYDRSLYYRVGTENKVYVSDSGLKNPLDKNLFDLRDKAIVTHEDKDVQTIMVETKDSTWAADRQGDGWRLTAPVQDTGDKQTIDGVLSRIHSVRAKSFPAESLDPKDAPKYGFDKPVVAVTFLVGADKAKKVLVVGEVGAEGAKKGYAHLVEGGPVEEIDTSFVKEIVKNTNELRDRTMLSFARDKVTKIEVAPATGDKFIVDRTKEKAAGATYETDKFSIEGKTDKLKTWKMSSALYALSNMKGAALVEENAKDLAKYGLDKPQWTYTVDFDSGDPVKVMFGTATGTRFYAKTGATNRVYEVEKTTVNELPKAADELIDTAPPPVKDDKASAPQAEKK